MSPIVAFVLSLAATLVFLGFAVATGLRAQRRRHIPLVVCALAALAVTIYFAVELGKHYDLKAAGPITPIHLLLAKVTTALYLLPIASGITTIFRPAARMWHRRFAFLVLGMTVLTAVTGTAMMMLAPRLG